MQETQEFGVVLHNQRMLTALLMLSADSAQAIQLAIIFLGIFKP